MWVKAVCVPKEFLLSLWSHGSTEGTKRKKKFISSNIFRISDLNQQLILMFPLSPTCVIISWDPLIRIHRPPTMDLVLGTWAADNQVNQVNSEVECDTTWWGWRTDLLSVSSNDKWIQPEADDPGDILINFIWLRSINTDYCFRQSLLHPQCEQVVTELLQCERRQVVRADKVQRLGPFHFLRGDKTSRGRGRGCLLVNSQKVKWNFVLEIIFLKVSRGLRRN